MRTASAVNTVISYATFFTLSVVIHLVIVLGTREQPARPQGAGERPPTVRRAEPAPRPAAPAERVSERVVEAEPRHEPTAMRQPARRGGLE